MKHSEFEESADYRKQRGWCYYHRVFWQIKEGLIKINTHLAEKFNYRRLRSENNKDYLATLALGVAVNPAGCLHAEIRF